MKKNIESVLALYPMPAVVVLTMIEDKPTWLQAGHVGIIGHDRIWINLHKAHHTNQGVRMTGHLSVNIVDEAPLPRVDILRFRYVNARIKVPTLLYISLSKLKPYGLAILFFLLKGESYLWSICFGVGSSRNRHILRVKCE